MLSNITTFIKLSIGKKIHLKEFKTLVRTLAVREWHLPFEYSLKKLDPALDISYARHQNHKSFIFEGRGCGTLKPYRVLKQGNKKTFEKIFFNDSEDLKANMFFYKKRHELLKEAKIKVPECQSIIKGNIFSILLYEYWDLKPLPPGREYKKLRKKTLELYRCSPERDMPDLITFDKFLFGKKRLLEKNVFTQAEFKLMDQIIEQAPVIFQHLDLSENNVFKGHKVIDWDNSGYFPLGMDFGRLLLSYFIFRQDKFYQCYEKKIVKYYKHLRHEISFAEFQILTMYFFIVFYYGQSSGHEHWEKIQPFINDFKNLIGTRIKEWESA